VEEAEPASSSLYPRIRRLEWFPHGEASLSEAQRFPILDDSGNKGEASLYELSENKRRVLSKISSRGDL
jgi:hypothetical protein